MMNIFLASTLLVGAIGLGPGLYKKFNDTVKNWDSGKFFNGLEKLSLLNK